MKGRNIVSFLIGASVGAGLTWLFTTDEGKKLMSDLKERADELKDEIGETIDMAKRTFSDTEKEV
jgi:hypothetical protein